MVLSLMPMVTSSAALLTAGRHSQATTSFALGWPTAARCRVPQARDGIMPGLNAKQIKPISQQHSPMARADRYFDIHVAGAKR
jgi:hypothetical protein